MDIFGIAKIAGAIIAVGTAAVAAFNAYVNGPQTHQYAIAGQGPVNIDYRPQCQNQVPYMERPTYPATTPVPAPTPVMGSSYPWGYNAYIAAIANTPMVEQYHPYPNYPVQNVQLYRSYSAPMTQTWHCNYGQINCFDLPVVRPSPGAPPGNYQPQFDNSKFINYYPKSLPTMESYVRTYANGSVSFGKIPSCYDNNGGWRWT